MKNLLVLFSLIAPTLSFASIYNCNGGGLLIELTNNPMEMKIKGNGMNVVAQDVQVSSTFNTVASGNIINPAATVRLTINDSHFGNPGERFSAGFQLSSSIGVKKYSGIVCIRGND